MGKRIHYIFHVFLTLKFVFSHNVHNIVTKLMEYHFTHAEIAAELPFSYVGCKRFPTFPLAALSVTSIITIEFTSSRTGNNEVVDNIIFYLIKWSGHAAISYLESHQ